MKHLYPYLSFIFCLFLPLYHVHAQYAYQMQLGSEAFNLLQLNDALGVATDGQGNVYVANTRSSQIIKLDGNGQVLSRFGVYGSGNGQLSSPGGMAVDGAGNIYIVELSNNRVQKFSADGAFIMKFGSQGTGDGQFYAPSGIALDAAGNIYVTDGQNNRVQKFNANGVFLMKIGGLASGAANGQFYQPNGIALDSQGNIYVSDLNNNRIQKFNAAGSFLMSIGSSGYADGQLSYPTGVALDSKGNIYVSDQYNNRIQKFSPAGTLVSKWGTKGSSNGQFIYPQSIALDKTDNILVVDQSSIQKFTSTSTFLWRTGSSTLDGQLDNPYNVTTDSQGNIYVSDFNNDRIQKFNSSGQFVAKFGTGGTNAGQLDGPRGIAADGLNNIFIAEYFNSRIQKFSASGQSLFTFGSLGLNTGQFNNPCGLSLDGSGNIYVLDYNGNTLQKFNSSGGFLWEAGGSGIGTGDGQFYYPTAIAADAQGNIFVADGFNHRIQKFNTSGAFVMKFGSQGTSNGQFNNPQGIAIDGGGNIYVTDNNHRVQKFNASGQFIASFGSRGNDKGQFQFPSGISVDAQGNLYVADRGNHRIQKFVPAPEVLVKVNNGVINHMTGSFLFNATPYGTEIAQIFTIDNILGLKDLTVGGLSLPAGYVLSGNFPSLIPAGGSSNFTVKLSLQPAGTYSGNLSFTTTDPDKPTYSFVITGHILKQNQNISFTLPNKTYGDEPFLLTGTATSGLPVIFSSSNPAVATITDNKVTIVGAGTIKITASQAGNESYNATAITSSYIINKAYINITWSPPADIVYGTALNSTQLNAQAFFKNTPMPGKFTYDPAEGTVLNAGRGQYLTVNFTPDDAVNFNTSAQLAKINVMKADQTISFPGLADRIYDPTPITLSAESSSGLEVNYTIMEGPTRVTGNTLTLTGIGKVIIKASQVGDNNYNPASDVTGSFCVLPARPQIEANGILLHSSSPEGNQWYINGNPVNGATGQDYIASTAGNYTVGVRGSCGAIAMSEIFTISVSGTEDADLFTDLIKVYPNPATTHFTVELPKDKPYQRITLLDAKGVALLSRSIPTVGKTLLEAAALPKGMYILKVESLAGCLYKKLIIQ